MMARIVAGLFVHERGCPESVRNGQCPGCDGRPLTVDTQFEGCPGGDVRTAILRARMAVMFKARRIVDGWSK